MNKVKKTTWFDLAWLFGVPTFLNYIACQIAIPYLDSKKNLPIEVTYFLSVGLLVLAPMFFLAIYLSGKDCGSYKVKDLFFRMRIKKLSGLDVVWTVGTFLFLVLTSYIIAKVIMPKIGMDSTPFFFQNMPLSNENMWILYIWPLFFFFNIFGEEFLWRGYIQPRQELLNKNWTWLFQGLFWAGWHIPMGFDLILAASPIFFILPAVVQIRKNTTIAIIVHTVFGAFGFLALSLGAIH
jgi:membrane protease YdiL (CAAX protease family)